MVLSRWRFLVLDVSTFFPKKVEIFCGNLTVCITEMAIVEDPFSGKSSGKKTEYIQKPEMVTNVTLSVSSWKRKRKHPAFTTSVETKYSRMTGGNLCEQAGRFAHDRLSNLVLLGKHLVQYGITSPSYFTQLGNTKFSGDKGASDSYRSSQ